MPLDATDRNLLFGVFALQADLIDPVRFAEACSSWASRKEVPLADLLVERGWITPEDRVDLNHLIDRRLRKHNGDVHASLAGLVTTDALQALSQVADPEIHRSLDALPQRAGHVLLSTVAHRPEGRGRYTVTHLHARGGLGQVWVAEDSDLGRPVALKEVRPDRAANPAVLARFLEEARITGQLEHPGIVPVYELVKGGLENPPFYTMRFIRGRTLTQSAKDFHRRRAAGEARTLELRELLNAFVAVCNAVAYAHSRGVIHRDLKGSNVILGNFGEVILLDWGLAKVAGTPNESKVPVTPGQTGTHDETHQGQVLGTPAYMPPEQAEGRLHVVNELSDVYGLGAILYEILTGRPPFDGPDSQEILQRVIHETPERPRIRVASVPIALEAVCLKALAKAPSGRYDSATALADEVRHWLAGEPVTAYPEPWGKRARRWMGRHHTLVTSGAVALVVAVFTLGAATVVLADANRQTREARDQARELQKEAETQRDLAQLRGKETQEQRDRAKANFDLARDAVREYTTAVANDPRLKEKDLEALRQDLLKSATKFFQKLTEQGGDDPNVRADLGEAHRDLAHLSRYLGDPKGAVNHGEKAVAVFEKLTAEYPDDARFKRELAKAYTVLGSGLFLAGEDERRPALYRRAIRMLEEGRDRDDAQGTGAKYLADAYRKLGDFLDDHEGQPEDVTDTYAKAVAVLEELAAAHPDDVYQIGQLGGAYTDLGWRYFEIGNPKKARELLDKSVLTLRDAVDRRPDDGTNLNSLGNAYHVLARFEQDLQNREASLAAMNQALIIHRRLTAAHPGDIMYQQCLARDLNNLGTIHTTFHETKEGIACYTQARELKEKIVERCPESPDHQADLARTLHNQSQYLPVPEAEKLLERAHAINVDLVAKHPTHSQFRLDLAGDYKLGSVVRERAGKWDEAEADCREHIQILTDLVEKNPVKIEFRRHLAAAHADLARLYVAWKKPELAEKEWRAALAMQEEMAAAHPDHVRLLVDAGESLFYLANLQSQNRQTAAAAETYERALRQLQAAVDKAPTNAHALGALSDAYFSLAVVQASAKDPERAVETCRQGVSVRQRIVNTYPEAPKYLSWLALGEHQLGQLLVQANQPGEAANAFARAAGLQEKLVAEHPNDIAHQTALVATYAQQGLVQARANKAEETVFLFEKELDIRRKVVDNHLDVSQYQFELAHAERKLGEFRLVVRRPDEAAGSFRNAVALLESLLPKASAEQLEPWRIELVQSLAALGKSCTQMNKLDDAAAALTRALTPVEQLTTQTPFADKARGDLMQAFQGLAEEYRKARKVDPGADAYRQTAKLAGPLAIAHPNETKYQEAWVLSTMNLGVLFAVNDRPIEALEAWRDSAALLDKVSPMHPKVPAWRVGLAKNFTTLAPSLVTKKKPELATDAYQIALKQHQKLVESDGNVEQYRRDQVIAQGSLANHLGRTGKFQDSDKAFGEAMTLLENLTEKYPTNTFYPLMSAATLCDWGTMCNRWSKHDEALKHFDKALPLLDKIIANEKNPQFLTNERNFTRINQTGRGLALRQLKRYKEAVSAYDKALELTTERERNALRLDRALALAQSGDHARAVEEAEAIIVKNAKPGELYDAACALSLASAAAGADTQLAESERTKLVEQHAARAVVLLRQTQEAGFFKTTGVDRLKNDSDLNPLRARQDYRKLVAEMEAATKTPDK
jgi:serine/threonine-protein kinase